MSLGKNGGQIQNQRVIFFIFHLSKNKKWKNILSKNRQKIHLEQIYGLPPLPPTSQFV